MKINQKTKLILLTLTPVITGSFLLTTISCGNKSEAQPEEKPEEKPEIPPVNPPESKTELEQLINEKKIILSANDFGFSKEFLLAYQNDIEEIQKLVFIKTKPADLDLDLKVLPEISVDDENNLHVLIKLTNLKNQETYQYTFTAYSYGFLSNEDYLKKANEIIANSIYLKTEYENSKLIDLMLKTKSNQDFINTYINTEENLKKIIGIRYQLKIISQNIIESNQGSNYFKFKMTLLDKKSNTNITPQYSAITPHLKLSDQQKTTFTIINNNDLAQTKINNLSYSYFGQTIIREEQKIQQLKIGLNLSGKNIIGTLDFSPYNDIEFLATAKFNFNKITNLIFNPNSKIKNLQNSLFTNNDIEQINLPQQIINYDPDCFDEKVQVFGINFIENFHLIYDENQDLRLDKIKNENELNQALKIITRLSWSQKNISIKKVYLPSFVNNILNNFNLECEEVIIPQDLTSFNISKWKTKKVHIPSTIIKISRSALPSNSEAVITREINEQIKNLIQNQKLIISSKTKIPNSNNLNLWNEKNNLDDYFYTFTSTPLMIKEIEFQETNISDSWFSTSMLFFKNNINNKKIIFTNQVASIHYDFWNNIKSFASLNNAQVERTKWLNEQILDSQGALHIAKLYENTDINSSIYNYYLTGYESLIKTIDLSDVNTIKANLFANLKLENIQIQLTNSITTIEDRAFYYSTIQIKLNNDFNPTKIGNYAFANSTIAGELNFSNLIELGSNAFQYTKITKVQFDQLTTISDYAFYYCDSLTSAILTKATTVQSYGFYSSAITTFSFENISHIGNYAFASCKELRGTINLKNDVKLGSAIFQSINTEVQINNFDFQKYNIFTNLTSITTSLIPKISSSKSDDMIEKSVGYNKETKVLDWSQFTSSQWANNEWFNDVILFSQLTKKWTTEQKVINELILPEESEINRNWSYVFNSTFTIKKLTWNSISGKKLSGSLNAYHLGGAKIEEVNEDFFVGMKSINDYSIPNTLKNKTINLEGVEKVGNAVFQGLTNVVFNNTESVKEIGSQSFDSTVTFKIGTNVKLKQDSFSTNGIPKDSKITRDKIFESFSTEIDTNFSRIYNQNTKIIDFSKIELKNPNDITNLNKYQNISDYLLDGDVAKIIMPKSYILNINFFSNLGNVQEIEFQKENQVILKNAFAGTTFVQKPTQISTSIILDQDNFFN